MSLQFVIRDDDLCYFTNPDHLNSLYSEIWSSFPITFASVPWQKGAFAGHVPVPYWHSQRAYALGDNVELVRLIRDLLASGSVDLALHGIYHTYRINRHRIIPELIDFGGDFRREVAMAKAYLDDLFEIDIKTFVPPSNTIRPDLAKVLVEKGWNLLNLPGVRRNTRPYLSIRHQLARLRRLVHFIRYGVDTTVPLVWENRWEIGGFPLTPTTNLENLKLAFRIANDKGHPFVLATHYWEHYSLLPGNKGKRQYDLFRQFLEYVSGFNINPVRARDIDL